MIIRVKDFASIIPAEFRGLFDDDVRLLAGETCPDFKVTNKHGTFERGIDAGQRRIQFVASDDSVDRDDEIIAAGAFHADIGEYLKNPVLLAGHQHRLSTGLTPVIGRALEVRSGDSPLLVVGEFAETSAGEDHWRAYKGGHQRAWSVGFRVKDTERRDGRVAITRGELQEISAVAVPSNRNALVATFVAGRIGQRGTHTTDTAEAAELRAAALEIKAIASRLEQEFGAIWSDAGSTEKDGDPVEPNAEDLDDEIAESLAACAAAMDL